MSSTTSLEAFEACCFSGTTGLLYCLDWQHEHPDDPAAYPPPCLRTGELPCEAARAFASAFFSPPPGPPAFELPEPEPFIMYDPGPFDMDALLKFLDDGLTIDERLESFKANPDELFDPVPFDLDALFRSLDDGLTIDERLESFKVDLDDYLRPFGDDQASS